MSVTVCSSTTITNAIPYLWWKNIQVKHQSSNNLMKICTPFYIVKLHTVYIWQTEKERVLLFWQLVFKGSTHKWKANLSIGNGAVLRESNTGMGHLYTQYTVQILGGISPRFTINRRLCHVNHYTVNRPHLLCKTIVTCFHRVVNITSMVVLVVWNIMILSLIRYRYDNGVNIKILIQY